MSNKFLKKFFPPPSFLKVQWVGLEVSDEFAKLVQIKDGLHGLELGKYAEKAVPSGVIVSGQIADKNKLISILKELRKISPTSYVNASLPEEKSFLFTAVVNFGTDDEIRRNIEYILEENVPIPPSETLFEFDIIGKSEKDENKVLVSVTAMPSKVAEEYNDIFTQAGFKPYLLEVEGRPFSRSLIKRKDKRTFILVNFNDRNVGLFLVSENIIRFTSTVRLDRKEIPESYKTETGFDIKGYVKNEIEKVYAYWYGKDPNNKPIDEVVLAGKNASDGEFMLMLRKTSKAKVRVADVWINVSEAKTFVPEIEYTESLKFATAIGLAIKGR
ncbi:MAG: pilus assembly protein PilM [bacterium]|nr:pilus assembly protein PilM [bacterium]